MPEGLTCTAARTTARLLPSLSNNSTTTVCGPTEASRATGWSANHVSPIRIIGLLTPSMISTGGGGPRGGDVGGHDFALPHGGRLHEQRGRVERRRLGQRARFGLRGLRRGLGFRLRPVEVRRAARPPTRWRPRQARPTAPGVWTVPMAARTVAQAVPQARRLAQQIGSRARPQRRAALRLPPARGRRARSAPPRGRRRQRPR